MRRIGAALLCLAAAAGDGAAQGIAIRDLGRVDGWSHNALFGYGLVTGLAGTGDSPRNRATRQSLSNVLAQFGINVPPGEVQSRNVAAVMVATTLPPFASRGDRLDVTVTSIGDARSLLGGALLLTPLRGADNRVRALAQGALAVGGYQYDFNGNLAQKNHPTVGAVPLGAIVEAGVTPAVLTERGTLRFVLAEPDYTMASRVAEAINGALGEGRAWALDASSVEMRLPAGLPPEDLVAHMTRIENLSVAPMVRARVVINERTGTVVAGGDVRISKVTISHGDLRVSIVTENYASQPTLVRQAGPDVRTVVVRNTRIDVAEDGAASLSLPGNNTVADLVDALHKVRTSTRDVIAILQAIKAAGALHAELVIQ